jgi:glutamine synthetase
LCVANPARLDDAGLEKYGITQRLPQTLEEALQALERDEILTGLLPQDMITNYAVMKRTEQDMLSKMEDWERRIWLIERY